jgi:glycosyltransferase involved in cell wall biosynthesis
MHIAMIAPPWFPIPPLKYGGIEQVVFNLVESLTDAGHRVTLFAPKGSETSADLVPTSDFAAGLDMKETDKAFINEAAGHRAYSIANQLGVDIIHDHTDYIYSGRVSAPIIRTVHGPVTDETVDRYRQMTKHGDRFIAISHRQRQLFEETAAIRWGAASSISFMGVIYNPIDVMHTPFYPTAAKEDYAAFVGRCHWEKGPDHAIEVARDAGVHLKMAMRVSRPEKLYFDNIVRPLLDANSDLVEFIGEIGGPERDALYGKARALIFSSAWEEPFGLTMVEAMAHGTPVLALRRGSAPEIVDDGVTGALCDRYEDMAAALPQVMALDPAACRAEAMSRFDRSNIGQQYVDQYELAISRWMAKTSLPYKLPIASAPQRQEPTIVTFSLDDNAPVNGMETVLGTTVVRPQ